MASAAVDLLIGKIISVIENEASFIGGLSEELSEIKHELVSMRSFLKDAYEKRGLTEGEQAWVANVRDIAYTVEDIIDEFMYHMIRKQQGGKFTRLLHQTFHFPKYLWVKHQMAGKLRKINQAIKSTSERRQRYGVDGLEGKSSCDDHKWVRNHGESSLFIRDDDLVGIEDDRQLLVEWLMGGDAQRTVVSVVGMGGSGKTTLAAKVYNSQIVKRNFDCSAWITISQTYAIEDLFKGMIKEFYVAAKEVVPMDLSSMSYRQLLEMLVKYLRPKRYVIVLDDVWNINLWREINVSLPDENNGSRIMLTTRKEDIASFSFGVGSYVHRIQPLGKSEAWTLFCMKAFPSNPNKNCPQNIESLARALVDKCEGLPLAIVALGGLMSTKKLEADWRKAYNSLNWELSNNPMLEVVKSILFLSVNDLPYRLMCCFLYCCLFPEDYLIRRKRLIKLWIAEGFVEHVRGITLEEVAESYLMELICRSMLQVVIRNPLGRPKACKMHDLMRELALSTSKVEKFCAIYDRGEESVARRLSIQTSDRALKSWKGMSRLRSLLVFAVDKIFPTLETLPSGFRMLRVLDLEKILVMKLPNELVDLFNLRYLNLKSTKVKELPKSIGRLHNLQTLDIRDSDIKVLPAGIAKMQNLRHLLMTRYNHGHYTDFEYVYGSPSPSNICKLKNLQVLDCVEAEADFLRRLRSMTQLTRFGITKVREAYEKDLCISIQNMNLLHHLFVMVSDEEAYLRMDALSSAPPCIKTLVLAGKLEKVPHWFSSLESLTYLYLHWSRLTEDLVPNIQALPNLGDLTLINAYTGNQLCFGTGFQKLRRLHLSNFPELNEIIIERGVMPGLQKLYLGRCMELKMLPCGIEYLKDVEELDLAIVSNELIERIRGEGSMDRPKVQHVPKISHYFQSPYGILYESLSWRKKLATQSMKK